MRAPSLRQLAWNFLRIGAFGFGGQLVVLEMIRDSFVSKNRWLSEERFQQGASLAQLLPGPTMIQMATFVGEDIGGLPAAVVSASALLAPAFFAVMALGSIYRASGELPVVQSMFSVIAPAAIALVASAAVQLSKSGVRGIGDAAAVVAGFTGVAVLHWQPALLLVGVGLVGMFARNRFLAAFFIPLLTAGTISAGSFVDFTGLFFTTGALAFGGGAVVVPLLQHDVVERFHWLTAQQFIDGVALGQVTPGPIMIAATFMGLLAFGIPGALVGTVGMFTPGIIYMVVARRTLARWKDNPWVRGFLSTVYCAAIGSVFGAAVLLARLEVHAPIEWAALVVAFATSVLFKQSAARVYALAGIVGVIRYLVRS